MAIPKFQGGDCELSTTGVDSYGRALQSWEVTKAILPHVPVVFEEHGLKCWPGTRKSSWNSSYGYSNYSSGYGGYSSYGGYGSSYGSSRSSYGSQYSSDCLRQWIANGQCYYSDMGHVEVCLAETLSPKAHAAQMISTLMLAEKARQSAEVEANGKEKYTLTAHNVDPSNPSISWGAHFNVQITKELFEDLFVEMRHPARFGTLVSGMAAAVAFFGCGYLLPLKNGSTIYSLSGRAHHLGLLKSYPTTEAYRRGILNERRESHTTATDRLHLIGFDFPLVGAALRCCLVQCLVAAVEEGFCGLQLYDPVRALRSWSWGMDLESGQNRGKAPLTDGRQLTLSQYISELTTVLQRMVEGKLIGEAIVPEARGLLPLVAELADRLDKGDIAGCARHLDWAAKLMVLLNVCQGENVQLGDPLTVLADQDYSNTDPTKGTFWDLWEQGVVDPLVSQADAEACLAGAPAESRAWARGRMIQKFAPNIADVDWGYVEVLRNNDTWSPRMRIDLPELDCLTREKAEAMFDSVTTPAQLERILRSETNEVVGDHDPLLDVEHMIADAPRKSKWSSEDETAESKHYPLSPTKEKNNGKNIEPPTATS